MLIGFILLALVVPAQALETMLRKHGWGPVSEDVVLSGVASDFAERIGRSAQPQSAKALGDTLRFLLLEAGVNDAQVVPYTIAHEGVLTAEVQLSALIGRLHRRSPPTHFGVGQFRFGGRVTTSFLLVHRGVRLNEAIPRIAKPGQRLRIQGSLRRGYFRPRIMVQPPRQETVREYPAWTQYRTVDAHVDLTSGSGIYGIEIIADSQYGPVVLLNHTIYCGVAPPKRPVIRLNGESDAKMEELPSTVMFRLLNRHRKKFGLTPLRTHPVLTTAALKHATEMNRKKTLSHASPDTGTLASRIQALQLDSLAIAENLAEAPDPYTAFRAFLDSPGHARNLRLPDMTHVGLAAVGRYYAMTLARLNLERPTGLVDGKNEQSH